MAETVPIVHLRCLTVWVDALQHAAQLHGHRGSKDKRLTSLRSQLNLTGIRAPFGRCYPRGSSGAGHDVSSVPDARDEEAIAETSCQIAQAEKTRRPSMNRTRIHTRAPGEDPNINSEFGVGRYRDEPHRFGLGSKDRQREPIGGFGRLLQPTTNMPLRAKLLKNRRAVRVFFLGHRQL